MKLTQKQKETINLVLETENEINDLVYFKFNNITNKVYMIQISNITDKTIDIKWLKEINSRIVYNLEEKGLLILKNIKDSLNLLTLNKKLIQS
jgi:hypothetical protein